MCPLGEWSGEEQRERGKAEPRRAGHLERGARARKRPPEGSWGDLNAEAKEHGLMFLGTRKPTEV